MSRAEVNMALSKEFMLKHGVRSLFPAVSDQLPNQPLNRKALFPFGYNPSILRHSDRILMAYRWHPAPNSWRTELAMAELDAQGNVTRNRKIEAQGQSIEDPRLFMFGGEPWISYVVSSASASDTPKCCVRYGRLVEGADKWTVEGQHLIKYGQNDGTGLEKNWVFYEEKGALRVIYDSSPETVILTVDGITVTKEDRGPGPKWPWGYIRGGTVPMNCVIEGKPRQIRFFHSRLNNEPPPIGWRYTVGAMLMCSEGGVLSVSRRPILRGSEIDHLPEEERRACPHFKANVVFPGGAVAVDGGWLLAVGVNDCACLLVKIRPEDLNL